MLNAEKFVELYSLRWREADPDRFVDLFHPEGGFTHPGPTRVTRDQIPAYWRRMFSVMPDLRVEVRGWASRGDVVYIEQTMSGTLRGQRLEWPGIVRFVLRGVRAVDATAHFDTFPLWKAIDPSLRERNLLAEALG